MLAKGDEQTRPVALDVNCCSQLRRELNPVLGVDRAVILTCTNPSLTDTAGTACGSGPFSGVQTTAYWSSTAPATSPASARAAGLFDGSTNTLSKTVTFFVWPVRGGK